MSLTVIIPVRDEEMHIARCLDSLVGWCERICVVDSFSNDRTAEIADSYRSRGVELIEHRYDGPADQKNWALDHLNIETEWVLFLDADESVDPKLRAAIQAVMARNDPRNGFFVNRKIIWYGQWMKRGGWYPNWNLRFFRFGTARYEMRRVHEHMIVEGETGYLPGDLLHEDRRDLSWSIAKHNRYSDSEAAEYRARSEEDRYARFWTFDRLARKRWIKMRIWRHLPGKAILYFIWAYVLRLGFLDGKKGFYFHSMHAMYKHFDELKVWELRQDYRTVSGRPTPAKRPQHQPPLTRR